jgi:pimeloyl-ACP methyl ester carboxylesterase
VDRFLVPDPSKVSELRRSAEPFLEGELVDAPQRFLSFDEDSLLPIECSAQFRRGMRNGVILRRRLATTIAPEDPILLEHWMHPSGTAKGTILAVHGFTMGWPQFDAIVMMASEWFRRGLDVALLTLPYHGPRTPSTSRFSGDRFASPDVGELNAAANRGIYEILVAWRWLKSHQDAPVGILGLSLGGYLAATVAGMEPELDFVIPLVSPACLGDLAWRFYAATRTGRIPTATPLSHEELRTAFRVHSPLMYRLQVPVERALIIAGRGDRIVPPEHPAALWRHWGKPTIHWFSGSHLAPFGRRGIVGAVVRHLEKLEVL